jgi:hypothetical protein
MKARKTNPIVAKNGSPTKHIDFVGDLPVIARYLAGDIVAKKKTIVAKNDLVGEKNC